MQPASELLQSGLPREAVVEEAKRLVETVPRTPIMIAQFDHGAYSLWCAAAVITRTPPLEKAAANPKEGVPGRLHWHPRRYPHGMALPASRGDSRRSSYVVKMMNANGISGKYNPGLTVIEIAGQMTIAQGHIDVNGSRI